MENIIDSLLYTEDPQLLLGQYQKLHAQYSLEKNTNQAILTAKEFLSRAEGRDDSTFQFFVLHSLGKLYLVPPGNHQEALRYLEQARIVGGTMPLSAQSNNYASLSGAYVALGNYNQALEYQLGFIAEKESVMDSATVATSLFSLGKIYSGRSDHLQALESYQKGLANIPVDSVGTILEQDLLIAIAGTYLALEKPDEALSFLQTSQMSVEAMQYQQGIAYVLGLRGKYHRQKGEWEAAERLLREAIDLFILEGLPREAASFKVELAENCNGMQKYPEALSLLDEVGNFAQDQGYMMLRGDLERTRAQSYEGIGRKDLAFDHLARYVLIRDSLLSDTELGKFSRTSYGFEARRKDAQIETLIQEQAFTKRTFLLVLALGGGLGLLTLLFMGFQRNRSLNQVNQVLALKNEEIKLKNGRLENSNEELRQFAHITSHDLREPLRSIASFATLLKRRYEGKLDEQADEYIQFITSGVRRMDALLADLLAYSVIGILDQKFVPISIEQIITEILETLLREKRAQGAKISIRNLPTLVADARQIRLLFEHLIDNAIKFRGDEKPVIHINCEKKGETYLFSVTDNGIGMEAAYQDKIFGLFLRLHNNNSKYTGTGIGLSICRKIVQQHKGKIWIESEKGTGTTVFFNLPESPLTQASKIKWRETV